MRYIICSVSDRAAGAFMRPFFAPSAGLAVRSFTDEVNRAESEMNKHPEDYELHNLGEWDEVTGGFFPRVNGPELLVRGKDVVRESD